MCYNLKFIDIVPMVKSSSSFSKHELHFSSFLRCQFWAPRTQVFLHPSITWASAPFSFFAHILIIFYTLQETQMIIVKMQFPWFATFYWLQYKTCCKTKYIAKTFHSVTIFYYEGRKQKRQLEHHSGSSDFWHQTCPVL